jgi:hypothetical protein
VVLSLEDVVHTFEEDVAVGLNEEEVAVED